MAKRKCVICGNYIDDNNDSVPYKNRYAHVKCFQSMVKMTATQKKKDLADKAETKKGRKKSSTSKVEKIKDAVSEEEYKEKIELYNYLRNLTEEDELSAKTYVLINSYIEKYSFTYSGIKQTLEYYFEIKDNGIQGDCIGIVPYYYTEAEKYFSGLKKIEEEMKNKNIESMYNIKTIRVPSQKKKPVQLLDIESIGK